MSPPYRQYNHTPHHYPHDDGRQMPRRPPPPARNTPQPRSKPNGYALIHHGKQVRVGPVVFWIITGSIILMGAWSAATATYFAFRDDVLTREGAGAGLGIAIARAIAETSGGRLAIDSRIGLGTTVAISLPLQPAMDVTQAVAA